ncbi:MULTISPECIES: winged helix-turn-helix transcriptional regulator [Stenotrophomonas]|uniref:Transcriptional regulator n=1 Tax=Stenotrophomonas maltophilia TaxID=40324 RepID=A0A3S0IT86_STEMA|nr:helix-turn-helix domain-containing protein [Stenotrophomonas maltophilia]RTQ85823.1 transcriptional regulator [Stenotrophomonas maltophilia]
MGGTHTDVRTGIAHGSGVCPAITDTLSRIGDKWTVLIVGTLRDGPMRYSELGRAIGGISQRMLTLTLKGLERDGLVSRTVYPSVPPRVDYELTELGRLLLAPLHALFQWAVAYQPTMLEARERYDNKSGATSSQ